MSEKKYYTVREIAALLETSKSTVYRMIKNGQIPHHDFPMGPRIPIKEFHLWERAKRSA